ncbi:glycosyltransferase [Thermoflexus sp.]|uniref:glycosyltransferase n=1 Tax=Thermoflexus sp. TaxID=1969742 RepID=UPI0035E46603
MNASRFNTARLTAALLIAIIALVAFAPVASTAATTSALDFHDAMRKLWVDHVTWTRLYIVSVAADLPDKDITAQRLLDNQTDIGNAIKPFYGEDAGNKLTSLLKEHILIAADLLAAAKAGDAAKVDAATALWYANADEIAAFLNSANPKNWPLADMKAELKMHLDLTLDEAVARLQGKFADDVQAFDKAHEHILKLADLLSTGIINQFPDRFNIGTIQTRR